MPNIIQGILLIALVFFAAFGLACVTKFCILSIKNKGIYKDCEKKEIKNAEQPSDAKIYYIKDVVPKKKPRKTVPRKPDLAFKGIVIRPEEFSEKKYYVNGK